MMIRPFTAMWSTDEPYRDDEDAETDDSDEVDSDLEFHLYSQIHYSTTDLSTVSDNPDLKETLCHDITEDDGKPGKNDQTDQGSVSQSVNRDGTKSASSALPFDKEDIVMLKEYLEDNEEDFVPESWEIIDSVTEMDSDDAGLDIHVSELQDAEGEENEAWVTEEGTKESWKIDDRDKIKLDGRNRYYAAEFGACRMRCRNCNDTGHKAKNCPEKKALPVCFMCGGRGHIGRDCRERRNHRFANKHVECNRCRQDGHMRADCPDLWRQFHITTEPGSIKIPRIPIKLNDNVQCYNCGRPGHFGHECDEPRHQMFCPLQKPLVHRYDHHAISEIPKDLRKKLDKKKSEGRNRTHDEDRVNHAKSRNTHIVFRTPSPPLKMNRSHGSKRKIELIECSLPKLEDSATDKTYKRKHTDRQTKKKRPRYDSSENFRHPSQHHRERDATRHSRSHHHEPDRKRQKYEHKGMNKHESREQSSRGFRRHHF